MNNDLISREALCKLIAEIKQRARSFENQPYRTGYVVAMSTVEGILASAPAVEPIITGETSDGYHTFNELYHHRAVLFSVIVKAFPYRAWKARQHHDGSMYDGMFIVGIDTPDGPATYHYDLDPYWDMFRCGEMERAPEWDGHTPAQAIERIEKLEPVKRGQWIPQDKTYTKFMCSACRTRNHSDPAMHCSYCGAQMYKVPTPERGCSSCENYNWNMPQCKECSPANGFKWYRVKAEEVQL